MLITQCPTMTKMPLGPSQSVAANCDKPQLSPSKVDSPRRHRSDKGLCRFMATNMSLRSLGKVLPNITSIRWPDPKTWKAMATAPSVGPGPPSTIRCPPRHGCGPTVPPRRGAARRRCSWSRASSAWNPCPKGPRGQGSFGMSKYMRLPGVNPGYQGFDHFDPCIATYWSTNLPPNSRQM